MSKSKKTEIAERTVKQLRKHLGIVSKSLKTIEQILDGIEKKIG